MMNEEGVFPRLIDLVQTIKDQDLDLHRMLLELLYEMSRIQRIRTEELSGSTNLGRGQNHEVMFEE